MRKIVWSKRAEEAFFTYIQFVEADSVQNAEKIAKELILAIDALANNPEKFPPDRFKQSNNGTYRAFEKFSLRVVYRFSENEVRILRVRHVKQEPKIY